MTKEEKLEGLKAKLKATLPRKEWRRILNEMKKQDNEQANGGTES